MARTGVSSLARLLLAAVACAGAAGPVAAGAWPRPPGETFVSLRGDIEREAGGPDLDASAYLERGLTPRFTLVAQGSTADDRWNPSRAGVALRYALSGPDAAHRFAVSLGVSTPPDVMGMMTSARLEAGIYWGRGFESRWGGGWATASARLLLARDARRPITDLNALVGLRPAEGHMAMLGLGRYADDGGTYWKLSPALGYELREDLWLVPGLVQELGDDHTTSVTLGVWWTF